MATFPAHPPVASSSPPAGRAGSRRLAVVGAVGVAALVLATGHLLERAGAAARLGLLERELAGIAALKADQIRRWRLERVASVQAMASDAFMDLDEGGRDRAPDALRRQVALWFRGARDLGDVAGVALLDARGAVRLSAGDPGPSAATSASDLGAVAAAIAQRRPYDSDLREDADGPHLTLVAPVVDARGTAVAGVLVRVDPRAHLFSMLRAWPFASSSAEVLLVRADGGGAYVLGEPAQVSPVSSQRAAPDEPGSALLQAAARGAPATLLAPDRRGVLSLAAVQPVPDTAWCVLVRRDAAEILPAARRWLGWILSSLAALLAGLTTWATLRWRAQRPALARQRLSEAVEREVLARRVDLFSRWGNDIVLLVDAQGQVVDANARAEVALGYTRAELLVLGLRDLRDPTTLDDLERRLSGQVVSLGVTWETRYRRKDGSTFPVEACVHLEEVQGHRWYHGLIHDITGRKQAEEALRASEARFRAAFDSVTIGMALVDRDGRVIETNRALQVLLGRAEETLRGRPAVELVHPDEAGAALRQFVTLRRGRARMLDTARRYRRQDGSYAETLMRFTALTDAQGVFQCALAAVEDVSEKHRLQSQLRLADRMASVGTLAAGVAHEINNPLAFVLANLEYALRELRREGVDQEVAEALVEAREGAMRVREIVRDLKTFSRADDTAREVLDLGRVLRSALSLASNEIRARARLEIATEATPRVCASERRLGQVFLNLLINAAQAIPDGNPAAHLLRAATGTHPDGRALVEISDDGAGIPAEIRARIFDPFFTTKPVGVGTGLGLSICHGIVTALGGEITVESEVGRGSTFRVLLPPVREEPTQARPATQPSPGRRARVLVVDDEPLVCRAVQRILSPPHEVSTEGDARAALAALQAGADYELVLCDLLMPEMTGMELYERVAATSATRAARFVFLTGGAFTGSARDFLARVPNERVEKPFDPAALRELVNRLLADRAR